MRPWWCMVLRQCMGRPQRGIHVSGTPGSIAPSVVTANACAPCSAVGSSRSKARLRSWANGTSPAPSTQVHGAETLLTPRFMRRRHRHLVVNSHGSRWRQRKRAPRGFRLGNPVCDDHLKLCQEIGPQGSELGQGDAQRLGVIPRRNDHGNRWNATFHECTGASSCRTPS